jgi:hypothetical protein
LITGAAGEGSARLGFLVSLLHANKAENKTTPKKGYIL